MDYKPKVKLIKYIEDSTKIIASAGKSTISPKNVESILERMDREMTNKWLLELIKRGHSSPMEHSIYTFEVICSRVTSHQIVRHRIASYTQLSQRYSDKYLRNLIKAIAVKQDIIDYVEKPKSINDYRSYAKIIEDYLKQVHDFNELLSIASKAYIIPPHVVKGKNIDFLKNLIAGVMWYYKALSQGVKPEDARYLLPQAVKTRILISMNARELIESFLSLRMCSHAQWEIRYIAWSLWRELVRVHPEIFAYAGPRCIYFDNRVRNEPCKLSDYLEGRCIPVISRCPELVEKENIINCLSYAALDPWS